MKIFGRVIAILLVAVASVAILERIAAERVEVVEMHAADSDGVVQTTRLWIVDDTGLQYLRVGQDGSGWFDRINSNDTISITRQETSAQYTTHLRPDKSERINYLMQEKYTWGDSFIAALVGSRENSIPIELHPVNSE